MRRRKRKLHRQNVYTDMIEQEKRLCCKCKYLLGIRNQLEKAKTDWRCCHPENIKEQTTDLVTGQPVRFYKLQDLYILRAKDSPICGAEGRLFEEYIPPQYVAPDMTESNSPPKPRGLKNIKLEDL